MKGTPKSAADRRPDDAGNKAAAQTGGYNEMKEYTAIKGDTVSRIAAAHGLTPEHVVQSNPWAGQQPYLQPGQLLFLPSAPRRRYCVQEGDDPESIAGRFGVGTEELLLLNPSIGPGGRCEPGATLVIPAAAPRRIVRLRGEYGPRELEADIAGLTARYPCVSRSVIGRSVMGKPLHLLTVGNGPRRLQVNAALHANEWLTSASLMAFIEEYAAAFEEDARWQGHDVTAWHKEWTLQAVPMANPDGVELVQEGAGEDHPLRRQLTAWNGGRSSFRGWKANIRGVDLGDQFPAFWEEEQTRRGTLAPAPKDYGGESPLSEPEAAALSHLAEQSPAAAAVSFHSQGQEIYWNYRGYEPPEREALAHALAAASGYRAVKLTGSDAGYKDWFIYRFGEPAFTVELGLGRNPLPPSEFPDMTLETGMILAQILSWKPGES